MARIPHSRIIAYEVSARESRERISALRHAGKYQIRYCSGQALTRAVLRKGYSFVYQHERADSLIDARIARSQTAYRYYTLPVED